ncbi:MFS transporter [Desulforamulus aeronauticus]|uniref:MFS transporter, putative metabolite:H+ symporter n=1 Tax=Desulforamulus aeronauticus DSM 10349 TaxID=1121421 RepID=A0A1M6S3B9_9FIRM|nr:MFS transporter [Desulforamulus aeronauticus]SHK39225.1 MFS transporter, putative metabolite:H+ symporter [Desulforamulus aeronauticus DSM 10349]
MQKSIDISIPQGIPLTNSSVDVNSGAAIKNNYFDGLPVSRGHFGLFLIIVLAYFFEQLDNNNFSFVAPALIKSWGITMEDIAHITSLYFVGMTLGGLLGGVISDFIGRRKTFLASIVIFSVASIANGFASNLTIFAISRAITGFGIFCMMVVSIAYISEMSPGESRGKWQNITAGFGFLAMPVIGVIARMVVPMHDEAWRYIFWMGGLGLIGFLFGLKYLKESPRWLVTKGRVAEAEQIMFELTGRRVDLSEAAKKVQPRENVKEVLIGMFSRNYIKRTIVLLISFFGSCIPGFMFMAWTPTLLQQKGFTLEQSLFASSLIILGAPIGCILSSFVSDKGGRKIPIGVMALCFAALAMVFANLGNNLTLLILVGMGMNAFNLASSFTLFSYVAESYPTKMRNTATGFHNAMGRLSVAGSQLMVPVIYAKFGFAGVFTTIATCLIILGLTVLIFGERTGGKSLEEIT